MKRRIRPVLVGLSFASGAPGAVSSECDLCPYDDQDSPTTSAIVSGLPKGEVLLKELEKK